MTIPDEAVEAAAKAMYECRPRATDPAHWETPWEDVPDKWKRGQRAAALAVLEAALGIKPPDTPPHNKSDCPFCQAQEEE